MKQNEKKRTRPVQCNLKMTKEEKELLQNVSNKIEKSFTDTIVYLLKDFYNRI